MSPRAHIPLRSHTEILARQAICIKCGQRLGKPYELHHVVELAHGGTDTIDNLIAIHVDCHAILTNGTRATTLGSSKHTVAKAKRLSAEQEAFRRRVLAKPPGSPAPRKNTIPSRPFQKKLNFVSKSTEPNKGNQRHD